MSMQPTGTGEHMSERRVSEASTYSAHLQEAMRYNKLLSADYSLVMTILNAVLYGYSEERWRVEQQRTLTALSNRPTIENIPYADAANRFEQIIMNLKDLRLWPWE